MNADDFTIRHIGPDIDNIREMLTTVGYPDIKALIDDTIPKSIRLGKELELPDGMSEAEYLEHVTGLGNKNRCSKSYIGQGYYECAVPAVIMRNIFENPGWYTAYTPYQAEISQGRLEGLLNFQTAIIDLTGMDIANASLLDEATAAAEAMIMIYHVKKRKLAKTGVKKFFVDEHCFAQTIDVMRTRAASLGIELVTGSWQNVPADCFGVLVQYPDAAGMVNDYRTFVTSCHEKDIAVVVAADILSLVLLTPPGSWGADVVVGSTQRMGVPMGFGGPHAAYFATKDTYKRNMPGRIIGVSVDRNGNKALRMALQTREQHIRRDKATSNICTAQAMLAIMAGMYAVYHGEDGLKHIASVIARRTINLATALDKLGFQLRNNRFFDTLGIVTEKASDIQKVCHENGMNLFRDGHLLGISVDECKTDADIEKLIEVFKQFAQDGAAGQNPPEGIPDELKRKEAFLKAEVFKKYRSETAMMRYLKYLENKDISLTHSMISLGSCTMKLNAAAWMLPLSRPEWNNIHPFAPKNDITGYTEMIDELGKWLCTITGFSGISFQPNSGAQGEYTGLLTIRRYQEAMNQSHRNIMLIPASAHGTNPASAVMAGLEVIVVKCDGSGNIDLEDLKEKIAENKDHLCGLMLTYPSTHGVFEASVLEVTSLIHAAGALVYMDGANMNAQVGLTNPAAIGADVCHLNLHKTFGIPHGGGGPGMGPIAVTDALKDYLPDHCMNKSSKYSAVSSAPYGSALILLISYGYVKTLGNKGLRKSTETAILNANYLKEKLKDDYPILYTGDRGRVAHEMILDCSDIKKESGISVEDISKRLMDFGFHAPTVSFPVHDTLMVEPTESEPKQELDRFCEIMHLIREEIRAVANGKMNAEDNPLVNAPHTLEEIVTDNWKHAYPRTQAHPMTGNITDNVIPSVARIDNGYGDRNLHCTCGDFNTAAILEPVK